MACSASSAVISHEVVYSHHLQCLSDVGRPIISEGRKSLGLETSLTLLERKSRGEMSIVIWMAFMSVAVEEAV